MQQKTLPTSHCEKICEKDTPINEAIIPLTHLQNQALQKYIDHIQI